MDRQAKLQELFDKYQLGVNYHKQGELESAEAIYREVLQFIPNHPDVLHMLGLAIYEQGNPENAVELIDRSIRLNPQQPGFHKHLAVVYLEMQQYEQAITCVKNAIALKPDYAAAYNLLGNIYQAQKDLTQALSSYQKAGELEPNSAEFRHNLGSVYQKLEDFTSAIPHHLKAIELQPDFAIAHNFLANAYHRLGERQKALTHWQIAVELAPQAPEIRCNLGLALLLEGDFNRGWQEYEWRLKTQALKKFDLKTPMWQGQDLQGKSIYLWSEQGLGDTIQFARYAWELKRRGAQVTLGVNKGLISLFTDCVTEKFQVVDGLRSTVYEHDYHVSVMSLPRIFGTDLTNIPQQIPYVTVAKIKTAIEPTDNYKIGIVWASKKTASQYTRKTCTPELFMDFLALGKVSLYSLQVGEDRSLITAWLKEDNVSDLSGELFNFADTAQFIAQLDLIITVDTAVAHLAGAMGKPTWLLLSYMPDWRWLLNRQDTPWYPTMRLFRQSKLNDWASVFTQVKEQLIKVLAGSDPVFPVDNKSGGEVSHQKIANQLSVIEQKKLDKKDITELLAKGLTHYQKQELSLAESYYQQVLEIEPQHPEALHILGLIAYQENKPGLAIALLQRAIQQNPSTVNYYQNLALVYEKTGNLPEAIAVYQQAINLQPHKGELFSGLADCYRQQAQIKEAIQAYTQAIKLQVTHLDLYLSLGKIYEQENQLEQALAVYRQALKYHPNSGCLHNLMGIIYQYQGKIEQASAAYQTAISVEPNYTKSYNNLAYIYFQQLNLDKALDFYQKAISIEPEYYSARTSLALVFLTLGKWQKGWQEYEYRFYSSQLESYRPQTPMWQGEELREKSLVVWHEQGLGDGIQFVRYLELVKQKQPQKLVLATKKPLIALFKKYLPIEWQTEVVEQSQCDIYSYDYQVSIMSLPGIFATTLDNVPKTIPYLALQSAAKKQKVELNRTNNYKIGIVWSGDAHSTLYHGKSCPLGYFTDLLAIPEISLHSLQVGLDATEIFPWLEKANVYHYGEELIDFAETARIISQLDLIITVDTAVAHLAGAMGKLTWLILPYFADWRWLLDRQDTPWYPTMRLFRQPTAGDWDSVFAAVTDKLQQVLAGEEKAIFSLEKNPNIPPINNHFPKYTKSSLPPTPFQPKSNDKDIEKQLKLAVQKHQDNKLEEAKQIYQQVLVKQPNNAGVLNYLGVVCHQQKNHHQALKLIKQAIKVNPKQANFYTNLGNIYRDIKQLTQAQLAYRNALAIQPADIKTQYNLAKIYQAQAKWELAIKACSTAIKIDNQQPELHYELGCLYAEIKAWDNAITAYKKALNLNPNLAIAYARLATIYQIQNKSKQALSYAEKALALQPELAEILDINEFTFIKNKNKPRTAKQLQSLAIEACSTNNINQAIKLLKKAIQLKPKKASYHHNLGNIYYQAKDFTAAQKCYETALKLDPQLFQAYNNLANIYHEKNQLEQAINYYRQSIKIQPDYAEAHCNLGLALMLVGDWQQGFPHYEWRFKERFTNPLPEIPMWRGEEIAGKSIILWNEQGIGDELQFMPYAQILAAQGAKVTIVAHNFLFKLWRDYFPGNFTVINRSKNTNIHKTDYQASVMSLPGIMADMPNIIPYIQPPQPPNLTNFPQIASNSNYKIGIVWASKKDTALYERKTLGSPELLLDLLAVNPDITLYSLQVGEDAQQIKPYLQQYPRRIYDLSADLTDFTITADILTQLDLVITVDTAVAHLAGAMGKPVWVLLPFVPDWRWGLTGETTPWYPTMRLFRQPHSDDWLTPVNQVKEVLKASLATSHSTFAGKNFYKQGIKAYQTGDKRQAIYLIKKSIEICPKEVKYHNNLGNIYLEQEDFTQAEQCYQNAIALNPNLAVAYHNLANIYGQRAEWELAKEYYSQAISHDAKLAIAYQQLAAIYRQEKNYSAAIKNYEKLIQLQPNDLHGYNELGLVYLRLQQPKKAIELYQTAINLKLPESDNNRYRAIYNNLAKAYREIGNLAEAMKCCNQAIKIDSAYADAWSNQGSLYHAQKDFNQTIECYQRAISLQPKDPASHANLAMTLLLTGQWQKGWQEYEWRFLGETYARFLPPTPMWQGEDLQGKSIVIWNEQGLGDWLQFLRYGYVLQAKYGAKVILAVSQPLLRLCQNYLVGDLTVINYADWDKNNSEYDYHISVMSLPGILQITLDNIPSFAPYFQVPPRAATQTIPPTDQYKIGIVWASNHPNLTSQEKSCPWQHFLPLLEFSEINLYSLQVGKAASELEKYADIANLIDLSKKINDFADTAQLISQLDLIITVDTAVAHLAGAMGKPTWVLLPHVPDWRWGLDKSDTPWYQNMKLFRQPTRGDWQAVFEQVKQQLQLRLPINKRQITSNSYNLQQQAIQTYETGNVEEAIQLLQQAINLQPEQVNLYINLGKVYQEQKQFTLAENLYREAITLNPDLAETYFRLGTLYQTQQKYQKAKQTYLRGIELAPQVAEFYYNLGCLKYEAQEDRAAIAYYQRTIAVNPNYIQAHVNLSQTLLRLGEWKQAFIEREWRFAQQYASCKPSIPMWQGQDLQNKTILLWNEQGIGDFINFIRYGYLLAEQGAKLTVATPAPLTNLFKTCLPAEWEIIPQETSDLTKYDYHISINSLPGVCGATPHNIPINIPYFHLPESNPTPTLPQHSPTAYKIGIVWASNKKGVYYADKSSQIKPFLELLPLADIELYSLQVGADEQAIDPWLNNPKIHKINDYLTDFLATAYIINQLDLIITVDTAVAHLAGALGKPTWVLLPYQADWRWLKNRKDTPWYPTMRLFRQTQAGDWASCFSQIKNRLPQAINHQQPIFLLEQNQPQTALEAWQIGVKYHKKQDLKAALNYYELAISLQSNFAEAHFNLGTIYQQWQEFIPAQACYKKAIAINPNYVEAHNNLGTILEELKQVEAAKQCYKTALQLNPHYAVSHKNIGCIYQAEKKLDKAIASFQAAIQAQPDYADAHINLGLALMLTGEWEQGIKASQWRFASRYTSHQPKTPMWQGENLQGKTIVLWNEQGIGDAIQFSRYASLLQEMGAKVTLAVHKVIINLLQTGLYKAEEFTIVEQNNCDIYSYDYHISMLDLPGVFKHNPENLPNNIPYIKTNWENKNELFLPEMTSSDYKIGIVWGSNKNNTHLYPQKSCNLKFLADLLKTVEGISFYSLQVGEDSQVLKYWRNYKKIHDLSTQLTDFTLTAAAIAQLDLIITVDTAVAHLAGAMAKPVWLLLPYQADWRWGLSGEHSNWYPTMRLFRQTQANDWQSVFKTIEQELQKINKTGVEKVVAKIQTSKNPVKSKGFAKTRQQANKKPQSPTSVSKSIQPLGIAWSVDPTTGWGNYGLNLVLQLQRKPGVAPVMLSPANTNYILNPIHKQILSNLAQKQQKWQQLRQIIQNQAVKINLPVLHPLGNDINGGTLNLRGEKNIGVIFFENTNLSNEAIARGKAFDLIIAGSSWNAQVLKDRGLTNIATVLQGIAPNQFHPAPKSDIFRDRFVVFSGGKLEYRKGQDIVIAAFKRFVTRHPEALLLTAWHNFFPQFMQGLETTGNVIGLPEIDSQTKKLALTPWLVKNGIPATNHLDVSPIPNYLMGQVVREADVAVFPNRAEGGTNLVAMESLACGVPTILSTNTGHQDLLGEHCYQLPTQKPVQPTNIFPGVEGWGESNVDEVVEALEQVYQNRSQAQFKGEKAVEFMQDWTWEKQVERLSQAINCR